MNIVGLVPATSNRFTKNYFLSVCEFDLGTSLFVTPGAKTDWP